MTSSSPTTVLISGAGITGPALAYWLARQGFRPTVVESAPALRLGGQAVDLRGAGRRIIERMGLMEQTRAHGVDQRGFAYVDGQGRHLVEMTVEDFGGDGMVSELEILRGDLSQLLYDATADDTEYLFGRRVVALTDHGDGPDDAVAVSFDDGTQRRFDLVVGADGPHSGIRKLVFGPEEQFVEPLGGYNAWFTAPDEAGLDGWFAMYNEPGGLVVTSRPDTQPGQAKVGLSFVSEPLAYDRADPAAQRRILADRFAGVGWQAANLVAAASTAEDFAFDAFVQVKMPKWSLGRAVVVGDAACCPSPLTGMGTSLGLVGAYVLAGELGAAAGDHRRAFAAYEARMRPYATQGQQLPPGGIHGYAPMTRTAIRLRVLSARLMVSRPLQGLTRKLFFSRADAIDLPSYPSTRSAEALG